MELRVKRASHIDTEITVPGDKSISHRAAIIGALSNGVCRLDGFLMGDDCMRTVNALRALGVRIDEAEGNAIIEETQTRDHTERMLRYFFVRTTRDENGTIAIFGDQVPESRDFRIPGDLSSATYWLTAAAAQPGGHLLVRELGLNTTRTPVLGVLVCMGAQVREAIEDVDQLE